MPKEIIVYRNPFEAYLWQNAHWIAGIILGIIFLCILASILQSFIEKRKKQKRENKKYGIL